MENHTTVSEYKIDRTGWPSGEWDGEGDRLDFVRAGFACLLLRNHLGAWCGYVGVSENHPAFGKHYDKVDVEVHGGLTYAERCQGPICHVPQPGMPENVWWLGFDTLHCWDLAPGMLRFHRSAAIHSVLPEETYKNLSYARQETESLADQLAAHQTPHVEPAKADVQTS